MQYITNAISLFNTKVQIYRDEQAQIEGGDAANGEDAPEGDDAEMEEDDDEDIDDSDLPPELRMNEYDEDEDNEMNGFEDNIDGVDDIAVRAVATPPISQQTHHYLNFCTITPIVIAGDGAGQRRVRR